MNILKIMLDGLLSGRRRADRLVTDPPAEKPASFIDYPIPNRFRSFVLLCPRFQRNIISPDVRGFRFCPYCGRPIAELDFENGCHAVRTTNEVIATVRSRAS